MMYFSGIKQDNQEKLLLQIVQFRTPDNASRLKRRHVVTRVDREMARFAIPITTT